MTVLGQWVSVPRHLRMVALASVAAAAGALIAAALSSAVLANLLSITSIIAATATWALLYGHVRHTARPGTSVLSEMPTRTYFTTALVLGASAVALGGSALAYAASAALVCVAMINTTLSVGRLHQLQLQHGEEERV